MWLIIISWLFAASKKMSWAACFRRWLGWNWLLRTEFIKLRGNIVSPSGKKAERGKLSAHWICRPTSASQESLPLGLGRPSCDWQQLGFLLQRGLVSNYMVDDLLRQCHMCPPWSANCQVTGGFPVWALIIPNSAPRSPHLSFCCKVWDDK